MESKNITTDSIGIAEREEILGLTLEEVDRERAAGHINKSDNNHGKSYLKIITDNLLTVFNLLYAIVAVVLVYFNSMGNLTFLPVVIPNILLAIISEARAKATVDNLSVTTDPRATVIRGGEECEIAGSELVIGDIMRLSISRQILSDAIVVSGVCEVNESMLTGESVPVKKEAGDRLFAGSFVVSGSVLAEVDRVGSDNYVNTLEAAAKKHKAPSSNLFNSLDKFIKFIGLLMIPMAIGVAVVNTLTYSETYMGWELAKKVVEATSGSIIGMIPAGMYLLITLTLSLSVISLGRQKTLVQDMYSIEMLARADVLCLDKTGTITDGTMRVSGVYPLGEESTEEISRVMAYTLAEDNAVNATSRAMLEHFGRAEGHINGTVAFSSSRKYSAYDIAEVGVWAIGAPHFVPCPVSGELDSMIDAHTSLGERVLLLARLDSLGGEGTPVALITLEDRIRPGAADTISRFQEQDVTVKVISGDHAGTVSAIAMKVGIKDADKYISCESLTDEELVAAADSYAVFGRVTPEQKVLLIKTLKDEGHTVAMTGDGVNDTLALKEANCAIAMADGSEVARAISQIVLLDSDFSHLPEVVREGRRCINNVRGSATLFVMKTIFTILISLFSIITLSPYPFAPKNFMFLELFVIGIASFLLAFEPNNKRIEGNFIEHVISASLPYALAMFIPTLTLLIVDGFIYPLDPLVKGSIAMLVVTLTGLINLTNICRPYTKWRLGVAIGVGVGVILSFVGVAVFDNLVLSGTEYAITYAFGEPWLFGLLLSLGIAAATLMHFVREPLSRLVAKIAKKVAKN